MRHIINGFGSTKEDEWSGLSVTNFKNGRIKEIKMARNIESALIKITLGLTK